MLDVGLNVMVLFLDIVYQVPYWCTASDGLVARPNFYCSYWPNLPVLFYVALVSKFTCWLNIKFVFFMESVNLWSRFINEQWDLFKYFTQKLQHVMKKIFILGTTDF